MNEKFYLVVILDILISKGLITREEFEKSSIKISTQFMGKTYPKIIDNILNCDNALLNILNRLENLEEILGE